MFKMPLKRTEDGFLVYNLYVGGIPKNFTEEILQKYFSRYGEVSSVEIRFYENTTARYAFVYFKHAVSATLALTTNSHYISDGTNSERRNVKRADSWWQPNYENKLKIQSDSLIMMLNDDCLIHIFSFLSTTERIKLAHMNERFKTIFKITSIRNKSVSLLNLTLMEIRFICREFGQYIKQINLESLSSWPTYHLTDIQFAIKRRLGKLNRAPSYVAKYCYELRSLNLKNIRIGEYTKFSLLKNLTVIALVNCDINDNICFQLSKLRNLKHVDISENGKLTGKFLKYFPELTHLNLYDCVGLQQYHILEFCSSNGIIQNLKSLNLKSFYLTSNISERLSSFENLESLVISSFTIDFGLLSSIKKLKHLIIYTATLKRSNLTEKFFMHLETLFIIEENSFELSQTEKNIIFSMENLKKLGLIHCANLDDEDLSKIASMPELTYLNITGCRSISLNAFLYLFKKPNNLQHIDISEIGYRFFNFMSYMCCDVRKKIMAIGRTTNCTLYVKELLKLKEVLPWLKFAPESSVFPGMKLRKGVCYEFEA